MMPMRPAAEAPIWMLLAAPECDLEAAEPDAVEEEVPEPEVAVAPSNHRLVLKRHGIQVQLC
jgi:hypothetical protein